MLQSVYLMSVNTYIGCMDYRGKALLIIEASMSPHGKLRKDDYGDDSAA